MKTPNAVAGRVTSSGENQDLDPGRILRVSSNGGSDNLHNRCVTAPGAAGSVQDR